MFFKDETVDEAEDKNFVPREEASETQGAIILVKASEVFILLGVEDPMKDGYKWFVKVSLGCRCWMLKFFILPAPCILPMIVCSE